MQEGRQIQTVKHMLERNKSSVCVSVGVFLNKRPFYCKKTTMGEREETSLQQKHQCFLRCVNFDLSVPEAMEHRSCSLRSVDI